jgi:hypothetical protein
MAVSVDESIAPLGPYCVADITVPPAASHDIERVLGLVGESIASSNGSVFEAEPGGPNITSYVAATATPPCPLPASQRWAYRSSGR